MLNSTTLEVAIGMAFVYLILSLFCTAKLTKVTRDYFDRHGFLEIEKLRVLSKSTPEGAREFLVPSRLSGGHFYALAQSPSSTSSS